MTGIRFMTVGVLVTLIMLSVAVSPVYAGESEGDDDKSEVILGQINDLIAKYNGNHTGLMQAFSEEFGDTFYIIVKESFWSKPKHAYKVEIEDDEDDKDDKDDNKDDEDDKDDDSQGYVTVKKIKYEEKIKEKCKRDICITTTANDVNTAYDNLMANSKGYITLNDVYGLSTKLLTTWGLNLGLFDDIISWILSEYL